MAPEFDIDRDIDRDRAELSDALEFARRVQEVVNGCDYAAFAASWKIHDLVLMSLLQLGETVKRISPAFRAAHSTLPWGKMAGLRDRIAHGYRDIDLPLVWTISTVELPPVMAQLEALIAQAGQKDG